MRIGIDARELCGHSTGVGRHLSGLLGGWRDSQRAAGHSFILYVPSEIRTALLPTNADVRVVPGTGGTTWEQVSLSRAARRDHLNAFFGPGYSAPLALNTPTVLLVHDISFVSHPEWYRHREGLRRRLLTRWSAAKAKTVLTVSEAARAEIIRELRLSSSRVRCIYPGITALDASTSAAVPAREPLVVFAGSIFNRRHLPDLIQAFKQVARSQPGARLAIVGDNRTHPHQDLNAIIAAEGLQGQIMIQSYVPDAELADLYRRGRAFAFLSEYEGFGHPPLEALKSGIPPLLLDTPVAREVCGDAALYVTRGDINGIASALTSLLFDEAVRGRVLAAAPGVLARYSWTRAADQTLEAIECSI
jgi:glycosyltransferase involved in cell wall biosynthesis